MENHLEFKLEATQRFLAKIPTKIPTSTKQQRILEENSEAFLFFASGVIEIVKRQINDRFEIFDKENIFYIHGLRKQLSDQGIQKKTKSAISHYFTTPKYTKSKINTTKSSLWRLQSLRNQAMHGNIIKIYDNSLVFLYTIRDGKTSRQFIQKTTNPHRYFGEIFSDLRGFTAKIHTIL
jgi:hypothetical protein